VIYSMSVSLDGYIAGPDGSFDWTSPDEEVFRFFTDQTLRGGAGRADTAGVSHPNIAHWNDLEEHDHEEGSIHSAWRYLGEAAGTVGVGVNRIRIHPGCLRRWLRGRPDDAEAKDLLARHEGEFGREAADMPIRESGGEGFGALAEAEERAKRA
jgi:hypothetical protein